VSDGGVGAMKAQQCPLRVVLLFPSCCVQPKSTPYGLDLQLLQTSRLRPLVACVSHCVQSLICCVYTLPSLCIHNITPILP
jgi:hypothetical protein